MHDSFIAPSRSSEVSPSASRYASPAPLTCKSQGQQLHFAPLVMRYPGTASRGNTLTIETKGNKFRTRRHVGLDWKTSCFLPYQTNRCFSSVAIGCAEVNELLMTCPVCPYCSYRHCQLHQSNRLYSTLHKERNSFNTPSTAEPWCPTPRQFPCNKTRTPSFIFPSDLANNRLLAQ